MLGIVHPKYIHFHMGTSLIIGNLMRIRVTSVEWTWLGLEQHPSQSIALYTGDIVSPVENFDNFAQDFDLNVDLHLIDVDDIAPPTIQFSVAKLHALLLSSLLLESSLYFGVNEIINSQKLVGNLDTMTTANLGRQHQRYLDSYFKSS